MTIKKGNVLDKTCKECKKNQVQTIHISMEYNGFVDQKRLQTLCLDCFKKQNKKSNCYVTKK
jgi:hypothetical protein